MSFEGFADVGDRRSSEIADHAVVFMLRGFIKEWKQPVAFGFCKGNIKTVDLMRIINDIIRKAYEIGLKVIATVSDQGATNVAAINYLMRNSLNQYEHPNRKCFKVDDKLIYHIYDPPHLLKGIRNNLVMKNLVWRDNFELIVAKWDHIYTAYKIDNAFGELRILTKLTEEHCNPQKMSKKVSIAAQVLSHSTTAARNIFFKIRHYQHMW